MKILIDIGHPAHVHLFKNFAWTMQGKGHNVFFTSREKDVAVQLLKEYGLKFVSFGKNYNNSIQKIYGLIKFTLQLFKYSVKIEPDIFLSHGSIYASIVSKLCGKPHISLENNGNWEQIKLYLPFTDVVLTPWNLEENLGKKQIRLKTFHEMAYLRPKYFIPIKNKINALGLKNGDEYCIIRLVSWNASHDIGQTGISDFLLNEIIELIENKYRVFISSEREVPNCFKKYLIEIDSIDIHHVLSYASLCISEGATVASEAGLLGTPTLYINTLKRSYNLDQETFGTVFNCNHPSLTLNKLKYILSINNLKDKTNKGRKLLIKSRIDLTAFLVWFIENYPESKKIMRENPDYQLRFK